MESADLARDLAPAQRDASTGAFLHPPHWGFRMVTFMDFARWKWSTTALGPQVPTDAAELDKVLPVRTPNFGPQIPTGKARITWLGHASVLLEVPVGADGTTATILTDPVFVERCSPFQWVGPKRYRPAPLQVADLPRIDAVVLSHNHYDHMETTTLTQLRLRFPDLQWFVPLGNAHYLTPLGIPRSRITEQNWWDSTTISLHGAAFTFSLVPVMHWTRRGVLDTNKALWGGWVVQGLGGSFFFSGDTAYCSAFKAIGHKFGGFSVSAIPIGAYGPREVFSVQHCDVPEAIQIHKDVQSHSSLGIHWGTWVMTEEYYLEPKMELERLMACEDFTPDHVPLDRVPIPTIIPDEFDDVVSPAWPEQSAATSTAPSETDPRDAHAQDDQDAQGDQDYLGRERRVGPSRLEQ
ncbi:hypothetical protein SDRG_09012 [Saprolegnia diclina VS20]|uniref:Metallo-beta-lactamase domain-containing protein n=1 Tax=Saprolegnia diclina (strain VS20) TaxID=1156394 RepID=T0RMH0_SAPDV|nr:hypothetical protein SDRG_09012 [Saprolegnia diclina VS20]EQC33503.1 hypothetical protein SDRG_09012 [Saprolegnia diclina VS20]|eukprot:XP_008613143.1 hypothetical protein SDRG_09012 [Saprolegnia diclina VS20]